MNEKLYIDSTPELNVYQSAFEDWFFHYEHGRNEHKELARAAYAAGMGDHLVMANPEMNVMTNASLWTNTTVPMYEDEPEVELELEPGDIVKWGSGPEDYEAIRPSGFEGLWVLRRLNGLSGLVRACKEDLQIVRRSN